MYLFLVEILILAYFLVILWWKNIFSISTYLFEIINKYVSNSFSFFSKNIYLIILKNKGIEVYLS